MTPSLQLRLGVATTAVVMLFLITSATVVDQAFQASERLALRERMQGELYLLLSAAIIDREGRLGMPASIDLPVPELALGDSGLYAYVAAHGAVLWQSPSVRDRVLPNPFPVEAGEQSWQEVVLQDGKDYALLGYGFSVATPAGLSQFDFYLLAELAPLRMEVDRYRSRLWQGLLGVAVLLVLTQVAVLRWSLRPLRRISGELAAIETGQQQRIEGRYPAEIRQLTDNINVMLGQERARQTRYRNALADLAHSLKTPLAVLRCAVDQPETLAEAVDEQGARMALIVERQLQRAAMLGNVAAGANVLVLEVVERVILSLDKVYRDKNVLGTSRIEVNVAFRGDEADLLEVLGNLIDNAYKWSRQRVEVQGWRDAFGMTLIVHDDGPGIDIENFSAILQRGARADESAPGHGIGLAVVADIVSAYQGRLGLGTSLLGGAAVVVEFPV